MLILQAGCLRISFMFPEISGWLSCSLSSTRAQLSISNSSCKCIYLLLISMFVLSSHINAGSVSISSLSVVSEKGRHRCRVAHDRWQGVCTLCWYPFGWHTVWLQSGPWREVLLRIGERCVNAYPLWCCIKTQTYSTFWLLFLDLTCRSSY